MEKRQIMSEPSTLEIAVKERPILFSSRMVRAILAGKKTQTRRVVKPQPPDWIDELHGNELSKRAPYDIEDDEQRVFGWGFQDDHDGYYRFPYGKIGDRLWVRETCWSDACDVYYPADGGHKAFGASDEYYERLLTLHHYANGFSKKVPSIHMPRWASRIALEIERVRVERLHAIAESDAMAEGVDRIDLGPKEIGGIPVHPYTSSYGEAFKELWENINGKDSWEFNPWVWVIEFKRVAAAI